MIGPDYYRATNLAYEVLTKDKLMLPINLCSILRKFKSLKIVSYTEMAKRFDMSYFEFLEIATSNYGYLQRNPKKPWQAYIIYNDKKDRTTIRFTIAHELGHYILEHVDDDDLSNKEANCFARNILCPIPVVQELNLKNHFEYMDVFAVSEPMAIVSLQRSESDYFYITHRLYHSVRRLATRYTFNRSVVYELFPEAYAQ